MKSITQKEADAIMRKIPKELRNDVRKLISFWHEVGVNSVLDLVRDLSNIPPAEVKK